MSRSLNRIELIGNLTRDVELKYTPQGTAVCTFSVATNRQWTDSQGNKKDEATFHRIVAWAKLAEICSQYLAKGRKVYIAGRLSNRRWKDDQGVDHFATETVASDMIILDRKDQGAGQPPAPQPPAPTQGVAQSEPAQAAPEPAPAQPEPEQTSIKQAEKVFKAKAV